MNSISEHGHIRHQMLFPFISQVSVPVKMTTNLAAEEVSDSKATIPVKQRIIWRNVVLLTVTHLLALYTAVFELPRMRLISFIWRTWRLVFLLHTYTSI
jgi:hypothetical protein